MAKTSSDQVCLLTFNLHVLLVGLTIFDYSYMNVSLYGGCPTLRYLHHSDSPSC